MVFTMFNFVRAFLYVSVALRHLDDNANATQAYEQAVKLEM